MKINLEYNEVIFDKILEKDYSKTRLTILSDYDCLMFLIWGWCSYSFLKSQAGHVLKMFLNFQEISAWCSYKLGSYKKEV